MIPELNPNSIVSNPVPVNQEVNEKFCVICQDTIEHQPTKESMKEVALKCNHLFHQECIVEWFKKKHECPLCKMRVEGISTRETSVINELSVNELLAIPDTQQQPQVRRQIAQPLRSLQEAVNDHLVLSLVIQNRNNQIFANTRQNQNNFSMTIGGFSAVGLNIHLANFDNLGVGLR